MMKYILITVVILVPFFGFSQTKTEIWTDYNHNYILNSKFTIFGDVGYRFADNYDVIIVRPSVKYTITKNFMVMGGLGNFYTFTPGNVMQSYEFRPWQGVRVIWPQKSSFFSLKHYVRFEEQFVTHNFSEEGFSTNLRVRYQIGTEIDIWDNNSGTFGVSIPLEYEIFHSFNQSDYYIERDRIIGGIILKFRKNWKLELNYTLQRSGGGYSDLNPSIGIYRIRLKHSIFKKQLA